MNLYFSRDEWASGAEWSLSTPITWLCAFGTSKDWACLPDEHATVSILHFPWEKIWGCWASMFMGGCPSLLCQQRHISSPLKSSWRQGSRGEGTQGLHLLLLQAWTSWIGHSGPSHLPGWLGPSYPDIPQGAIFGWWGGPTLGKGHLPPWSGRAGWLNSPFSSVPMVWHHLGDLRLKSCGLGSPSSVASSALAAAQALVAAQVPAAAQALVAEGTAHL